jgi:hypothetical protein
MIVGFNMFFDCGVQQTISMCSISRHGLLMSLEDIHPLWTSLLTGMSTICDTTSLTVYIPRSWSVFTKDVLVLERNTILDRETSIIAKRCWVWFWTIEKEVQHINHLRTLSLPTHSWVDPVWLYYFEQYNHRWRAWWLIKWQVSQYQVVGPTIYYNAECIV